MKRFVYMFSALAALLAVSCQNDPETGSDGTRLTSQSQVNSYNGGSNVEMLIISGADITDLSRLNVSTVGTLVIQKTSVQNLRMPQLKGIGKELTIESNALLDTISDLSSLAAVNGAMLINNNPRLKSISGLLGVGKISGQLAITNNTSLGEDKTAADVGGDNGYGLFPVKYLAEHDLLAGGVKLDNNHPSAATSVDGIGTAGVGDWKDFVIDSKAAAEAFEPGGNTVNNLTVKGAEITNEVLISLTNKKLRFIKGTMTLEGTKINTMEGFFDVVKCEGSIILKDNRPDNGRINTNGLRYYTRIGGDLVIDNSAVQFWTNGSSFASITEIAGNLIVRNCPEFESGEGFESLLTVGEDVIITNCDRLFNASGMKVETIGGSLVYTDNAALGLGGFEAVKKIGGTVKIANGDVPDYGEAGRPGWCLVKRWIADGILTDTDNMELKRRDGTPVDLTDIEPCDGYNPGGATGEPQSYVIDGLSSMQAFVSTVPTEKETVVDLTIKGLDITDAEMSRVQGRVGTITGTVTWDGLGVTTTERFFDKIDCQGGIVVKNCPELGNPNGFEPYKVVHGDFILENCPKLATPSSPGWDDHGWSFLERVEGTVRLQGLQQQMGGSMFKRMKSVGGNFEIIGNGTLFWDFNGMPLEVIGGDLVIMDNPKFQDLIGLDKLISIGGNVTIFNNPVVPITSDSWVGYCQLKKYLSTGVIKQNAKITIGTTENPIDIKDVPLCIGEQPDEFQSYVLNGLADLEAFNSGAGAQKETVLDLTILGADITNDAMSRVQNRVGVVTGTVTWQNLGAGVTTTENFFNRIDCQGSIVLRNCPELGNPNGFETYTAVNGDFIIEDCPKLATPGSPGWDTHGWANVESVAGTFRIKNVKSKMGSNDTFPKLKTVGGSFEIIECSDEFWDLRGMPLTSIGGNLIIRGNKNYENLVGLDKLTAIGGDVEIFDNRPPLQSDGRIGLCLIKHFKDTGVISEHATIKLGSTGNEIDVDSLTPCTE